MISLTFANVKEENIHTTKQRIKQILTDIYNKHIFFVGRKSAYEGKKQYFLSRYYGIKVIILLDAIILEFKVFNPRKEAVEVALGQIEQKRYMAVLEAKGIPKKRIRKYGFAFRGKEVLIG